MPLKQRGHFIANQDYSQVTVACTAAAFYRHFFKLFFINILMVSTSNVCHNRKLCTELFYVPVNSKTAHPPPPGQTPGHLTFLKSFGQIPRYVASFDVKCPTR